MDHVRKDRFVIGSYTVSQPMWCVDFITLEHDVSSDTIDGLANNFESIWCIL